MKTYCISINGQKAVDRAREICKGFCYRKFCELGYIEIVVDEPGTYKGRPNKWVDISYIENLQNVDQLVIALPNIGFFGCYAVIAEETLVGSTIHQKEIMSLTL